MGVKAIASIALANLAVMATVFYIVCLVMVMNADPVFFELAFGMNT